MTTRCPKCNELASSHRIKTRYISGQSEPVSSELICPDFERESQEAIEMSKGLERRNQMKTEETK